MVFVCSCLWCITWDYLINDLLPLHFHCSVMRVVGKVQLSFLCVCLSVCAVVCVCVLVMCTTTTGSSGSSLSFEVWCSRMCGLWWDVMVISCVSRSLGVTVWDLLFVSVMAKHWRLSGDCFFLFLFFWDWEILGQCTISGNQGILCNIITACFFFFFFFFFLANGRTVRSVMQVWWRTDLCFLMWG